MANVRVGNSIFIDTTGDIADSVNAKVAIAIVTATAANASVTLKDKTVTGSKVVLSNATSGTTEQFDWALAPMTFPNGINVSACTNANVTLILAGAK